MQQLKAAAGFAVWFVGLTYIVLWVLTGALGSSAQRCDDSKEWTAAFCGLTHPQTLSPLVQLAGLLAAIAAFVRLLLIALRRARQPQVGAAPGAAKFLRRMRRPEPTVNRVKGRDHFGLRGLSP
jgi:hypothetical protein